MPYKDPEAKREYDRQYREANKLARQAYGEAYRKANPEKCRARVRAWEAAHPQKKRELRKAWQRANPEKVRASQVKTRYGLSEEQYEYLLAAQGYACACCLQPFVEGETPAVDHCHAAEREGIMLVRGLIHSKCNTGLGLFGDDPERLRAAAIYLEKHK